MTRLHAQWRRLYALHSPTALASAPCADAPPPALADAQGLVRALVIELARPADWPATARLWHGVQDELHLPAPAIAVNGTDGYQLWFSVSEAITADQAQRFLRLLQARYWADIPADRLSLLPQPLDCEQPSWRHADPVPSSTRVAGQWSAFVTRDLAPVFSDTPWLDIPPNPEGQADLLAPLRSIELPALLDLLPPLAATAPSTAPVTTPTGSGTPATAGQEPWRFLMAVMNDPAADLALRIEAAKALLPYHQPPWPKA